MPNLLQRLRDSEISYLKEQLREQITLVCVPMILSFTLPAQTVWPQPPQRLLSWRQKNFRENLQKFKNLQAGLKKTFNQPKWFFASKKPDYPRVLNHRRTLIQRRWNHFARWLSVHQRLSGCELRCNSFVTK